MTQQTQHGTQEMTMWPCQDLVSRTRRNRTSMCCRNFFGICREVRPQRKAARPGAAARRSNRSKSKSVKNIILKMLKIEDLHFYLQSWMKHKVCHFDLGQLSFALSSDTSILALFRRSSARKRRKENMGLWCHTVVYELNDSYISLSFIRSIF